MRPVAWDVGKKTFFPVPECIVLMQPWEVHKGSSALRHALPYRKSCKLKGRGSTHTWRAESQNMLFTKKINVEIFIPPLKGPGLPSHSGTKLKFWKWMDLHVPARIILTFQDTSHAPLSGIGIAHNTARITEKPEPWHATDVGKHGSSLSKLVPYDRGSTQTMNRTT